MTWPTLKKKVYKKCLVLQKMVRSLERCFSFFQNCNMADLGIAFRNSLFMKHVAFQMQFWVKIRCNHNFKLRKLYMSQSGPCSSKAQKSTWSGWQHNMQAHPDLFTAIFLTKSLRVIHTAPRNASNSIRSVISNGKSISRQNFDCILPLKNKRDFKNGLTSRKNL